MTAAMMPAVMAAAIVAAVVTPMVAVVTMVPVMAVVASIVVTMAVPGGGLRIRLPGLRGRRDASRHLRRQRRVGEIQIVRHRRPTLPPRQRPRFERFSTGRCP